MNSDDPRSVSQPGRLPDALEAVARPRLPTLEVGFDRKQYRRIAYVAVPIWLLLMAGLTYLIETDGPGSDLIFVLVVGAITGFTLKVIGPAMEVGPYFSYLRSSQQIEARGESGFRRRYPRRGYERLEFSAVFAEVREVRSDGSWHRVPINSRVADPRDWEAFVYWFRQDHEDPDWEAD